MARQKKKRRLRRWIILILVLALVGAGVWQIGLPMLKASITTTYDEYTATIGSISNALSFSGSFALKDSETLTASQAATVRTIYVEEGQQVAKGDRLMRLSSGETLKAGFDGTVNVIGVSEGDEVSVQTQLMQYADFTHMQVSIRVDEYDISDVYVGQACTVTVTALEKSFDTTIGQINYVSQSAGFVAYYTATADVTVDEGVYPGMQVTVTIPQQEANDVVVLKMDALSFDAANSAYVYKMDDAGALYAAPVTVGVNNGNYVEITSGLSDGDVVYVESQEEAESGGLFSLLGGLRMTQINSGGNSNRGNRGSYGGEASGNFGGGAPGNMGGMPAMPGGN